MCSMSLFGTVNLIACCGRHAEIVRLFLQLGASPDTKTGTGRTVHHYNCKAGSHDFVVSF